MVSSNLNCLFNFDLEIYKVYGLLRLLFQPLLSPSVVFPNPSCSLSTAGPTLCSRAPRHVGVEIGLLGARGARPGAEDCLRCGRFREQIEVIHGQCCVEVLGG